MQQFTPNEVAGEHLGLYERMYEQLDPEQTGQIGPGQAVPFLKRSSLDNAVLGQIWELADRHSSGSLDKTGVFIALKCIALQQNGHELTQENVLQAMPPPNISGFTPAVSESASVNSLHDNWSISLPDRKKYIEIFNKLGPVDGKVSGEGAKPVLVNSGLPGDKLAKIWELSDIDQDGQLDENEMIVALHLVYSTLNGQVLPAMLPSALVPPDKRTLQESARSTSCTPTPVPADINVSRRTSLPIAQLKGLSAARARTGSLAPSQQMNGMSTPPAVSPHPSVPSGPNTPQRRLSNSENAVLPRRPSGVSESSTTGAQPQGDDDWPIDVSTHAATFEQIDADNDGLINGAQIKQLLMQSGLAPAVLAHIWALADMNKTGTLDAQQFALVLVNIMHLIEDKRVRNIDPPTVLPSQLIPPSLRLNKPDDTTNESQLECLTKELEQLSVDKQRVDADNHQLQADMAIKQSHIKNVEVETNTLNSTVKQLERQKTEAGRRLADLDLQREALERTLGEMQTMLSKDEQELNELTSQMHNLQSSAQEQEAALDAKRNELQQVRDQEAHLQVQQQNERARLDLVVEQYGKVETDIQASEWCVQSLREHTQQLQDKLTGLQQVLAEHDLQQLYNRQYELLGAVQQFTADAQWENVLSQVAESSAPLPVSVSEPVPSAPAPSVATIDREEAAAAFAPVPNDPFAAGADNTTTAEDPFAQSDPFADSQQGSGVDPFASDKVAPEAAFPAVADDPFGANDPFGAAPTVDAEAKQHTDPFGVPINGTSNDAFGDGSAKKNGVAFADFADFGAFE